MKTKQFVSLRSYAIFEEPRMRISLLTLLLALSVPLSIVAQTSLAYAQGEFDDEFDDEFGDEESAEEAEATAPPPADSIEADLAELGAEPMDEDEDFSGEGEDDEAEPEEEGARDRDLRMMSTLYGPTGGIHVPDARGGAVDSFRLQLATEFFVSSDFLVEGDQNDRIGATLSLSWTPMEYLEVFASISSYANSNNMSDPQLFQVLGDTTLGAKGAYGVLPWLTVGGDLTLALLNTVGDIGLALKSTSFALRGNLTADLRDLDESTIPLIIRFGLQYSFDNSSGLVEDVEQQRYDGLVDPASVMIEESRHLITAQERFALNINRTDFLNIGLGFEAPLQVTDGFYLNPLLEWTWSLPVNRQGYSCLFIPDADDPDRPMGGGDGCLDKEGLSAFPMNLTLGVRVQPPVDGLSFHVAADIGLTGTSTLTRELATNAPYNVHMGLAYNYDMVDPPIPDPIIREVEREVEIEAPQALLGRVQGSVIDAQTGSPVDGAVIRFPGRELTALATGSNGRFVTYALEPGVVQFDISHDEYNPGRCQAEIPDERPETGELLVSVRCDLSPMPRMGEVAGTLRSDTGSNVNGASVRLSGPATRTVTSDAAGRFSADRLPPGTYRVRVDADGYLIKLTEVQIVAREVADPAIVLVAQPRRPSVTIRGRTLQIRRRINFVTNSAEISDSSTPLLTEIADVIIRNPNLRSIEIQGHTDNRGGATRNRELSQQRADAVRTWLITHGVEATRLTAQGYGQARPLVPNITAGNRARNRRVQFVIQEQSE